jgi:acylphosphatase
LSPAIRRRVIVRGRVQGVFFRDTVCRGARECGVTGWVANRADGTVEAVLEGDPHAVEAMIGLCRRGPRGAEVESVDVVEEPPEGLYGFSVR